MKNTLLIRVEGQTYSPSKFKRMGRERKVALMEAWFRERYTDPVHELPYNSREGGYQWLDGGPYSADDVIQDMFGDIAAFDIMREAIERLELDGFDWTPVRESESDEGIYSVNEPFPDIADMDVEEDDTALDLESLRREMHSRLDRVEELVLSKLPEHGGLGHNRPPEPIEDALLSEVNLPTVLEAIQDIRFEANASAPDVQKAAQAGGKLTGAAKAILNWLADRANSQIDNAVSVALGSAIVVYAKDLMHALFRAAEAVGNWVSTLPFPF